MDLARKIPSRPGYLSLVWVALKDGEAEPIMISGAGILSSVANSISAFFLIHWILRWSNFVTHVTGSWLKRVRNTFGTKQKMERTVDWPKFHSEVEALLQKCGKQPGTGYRLKHQLIEAR
ncbi:MAG: hypothetical protein NTY37_12265 [Methanothrix sp.]|nr:hypothetical protein [Methanothrix sp.]